MLILCCVGHPRLHLNTTIWNKKKNADKCKLPPTLPLAADWHWENKTHDSWRRETPQAKYTINNENGVLNISAQVCMSVWVDQPTWLASIYICPTRMISETHHNIQTLSDTSVIKGIKYWKWNHKKLKKVLTSHPCMFIQITTEMSTLGFPHTKTSQLVNNET